MSNELKSETAKAAKLLTERERIQAAMRSTDMEIIAAEKELAVALETLGVAEAENALAATVADTKAQRGRLANARENLEALQSRSAGLKNKLASNRLGLAAAKESLAAARTQYGATKMAEYQRKILDSVENLQGLMREAIAEAGAVGAVEFAAWLRGAHFPSTVDSQLNLLDPTVYTPAGPMAIDPKLMEIATPEHSLVAARLDRALAEVDRAAREEAARAAA